MKKYLVLIFLSSPIFAHGPPGQEDMANKFTPGKEVSRFGYGYIAEDETGGFKSEASIHRFLNTSCRFDKATNAYDCSRLPEVFEGPIKGLGDNAIDSALLVLARTEAFEFIQMSRAALGKNPNDVPSCLAKTPEDARENKRKLQKYQSLSKLSLGTLEIGAKTRTDKVDVKKIAAIKSSFDPKTNINAYMFFNNFNGVIKKKCKTKNFDANYCNVLSDRASTIKESFPLLLHDLEEDDSGFFLPKDLQDTGGEELFQVFASFLVFSEGGRCEEFDEAISESIDDGIKPKFRDNNLGDKKFPVPEECGDDYGEFGEELIDNATGGHTFFGHENIFNLNSKRHDSILKLDQKLHFVKTKKTLTDNDRRDKFKNIPYLNRVFNLMQAIDETKDDSKKRGRLRKIVLGRGKNTKQQFRLIEGVKQQFDDYNNELKEKYNDKLENDLKSLCDMTFSDITKAYPQAVKQMIAENKKDFPLGFTKARLCESGDIKHLQDKNVNECEGVNGSLDDGVDVSFKSFTFPTSTRTNYQVRKDKKSSELVISLKIPFKYQNPDNDSTFQLGREKFKANGIISGWEEQMNSYFNAHAKDYKPKVRFEVEFTQNLIDEPEKGFSISPCFYSGPPPKNFKGSQNDWFSRGRYSCKTLRGLGIKGNWENSSNLAMDSDPGVVAHELAHKLGLNDEYVRDRLPFNFVGEGNSLLNKSDLDNSKIFNRHIDQILNPVITCSEGSIEF